MQNIHFLKMNSSSKEEKKCFFLSFTIPLVAEAMVEVVVGLPMVTEEIVAETIVIDALVTA